MTDFDTRLSEALGMYAGKNDDGEKSVVSPGLEKRVKALLDAPPETLVPAGKGKEKTKMKKKRTVILIAAALALLSLAAFAAPAIMSRLNMSALTSEPLLRKTEVPDGWIGVYTAEDLDNIRNDLTGSYILMEDIDLSGYESWKPIGTETDPFIGALDGNGHVIRNMHIDFTGEEYKVSGLRYYLGLFGYIRCVPSIHEESIVEGEDGYPILDLLRWELKGYVKNLSLEDSVIIGDYGRDCAGSRLYAGGIAAVGDYFIGCQVKNTSLDITISENMEIDQWKEGRHLSVGGIAGEAYLIDSCTSNAAITVKKEADVFEYHIAGLSGVTSACVTSYFDGTIDCEGLTDSHAVSILITSPPKLLTTEVLTELIGRLNEGDSEPVTAHRDRDNNIIDSPYHDDRLGVDLKTKDSVKLHAFYTYKNLQFSDALLRERFPNGCRAALVTSSFHVFRAERIARKLGLDWGHLGAPSKWYAVPMNNLRELCAIVNEWRRGTI